MTKIKGETSLETRKQAEELLAELRRQAYAEGYEQAKRDAENGWKDNVNPPTMDELMELGREVLAESPQEKRDRIVDQAKADVEDLKARMISELRNQEGSNVFRHGKTEVDFVVNKEKRTVVALVKGIYMRNILAKGIAKCAPGDCFNEHIGKAIAIRRALGLEVPDEYLNAPQPTEVRVGDIIKWEYSERKYRVIGNRRGGLYNFINIVSGEMFYDKEYPNLDKITKIIDDSESIAP